MERVKDRALKRSAVIAGMVFVWALLFACAGGGPAFADSSSEPVEIGTYEQLETFISGVNDGSIKSTQDAVLTADIVVPEEVGNDWVPLACDMDHSYQGFFDGDGHLISGISIDRTYPDPWTEGTEVNNYTAFISFLGENGQVADLSVKADIKDVNDVAGIVSQNSGIIIGCTFEGTLSSDIYPNEAGDESPVHPDGVFRDSDSESGGIAAANMGTINRCSTKEGTALNRGGIQCGGIAGAQYNGGLICGCENKADVTAVITTYTVDGEYLGAAGGIAGGQQGDAAETGDKPWIQECTNSGTISCEQLTGGICGQNTYGDIIDCTNDGKVEGVTRNWGGGIAGSITTGREIADKTTSLISGCVNRGDINTSLSGEEGSFIGGIAGAAEDCSSLQGYVAPVRIKDCRNYGKVGGRFGVGGVLGRLSNSCYDEDGAERTNVYELMNFGQVTGQNAVGGIAGAFPGVMASVINYGSVKGTPSTSEDEPESCIGGIAGDGSTTGNVSCAYNLGSVTAEGVDEKNLYLGGVFGSGSGDLPGCYFCMETSGSARCADGTRTGSSEGILSLVNMADTDAKTYMPELFDGTTGFYPETEWITVENQEKDETTYAMTPQINALPVSLEEILAAGVDTSLSGQYDISSAEVIPTEQYTFNSAPVVPKTGLKVLLDEKELTQGVDYVIFNCFNNTSAGNGDILLMGTGDYYGSVWGNFDINPGKAVIKSLTVKNKKIVVKMKGMPAKYGAEAYTIQYRVKGAAKWKTVTCKTSKKVLKNLKKGKKYQVRAQAFKNVDGEIYTGEFSRIVTSKKVK